MTPVIPVDTAAVERALDEVRPFLAHDGGNVELVEVAGDEVRVRLLGPCSECSMKQVTLRHGIERVLVARVPAIRSVVAV